MESGPERKQLGVDYLQVEDYITQNVSALEAYLDEAIPQLLHGLDYDSLGPLDLIHNLLGIHDRELINDREAVAVCYNSFRVAWAISDVVTPEDICMSLEGIFEDTDSAEIVWEQLTGATQQLLSRSPYLDGLIGRYQDLIDPSGKYEHFIETFAALAVAMIESGEKQRFINKAAGELALQVENWNGEIE